MVQNGGLESLYIMFSTVGLCYKCCIVYQYNMEMDDPPPLGWKRTDVELDTVDQIRLIFTLHTSSKIVNIITQGVNISLSVGFSHTCEVVQYQTLTNNYTKKL